MWPFKKKEQNQTLMSETQAKIDATSGSGEEFRQEVFNMDTVKVLQPFSYVVLGDEKFSYGMILSDTQENARAEAASDWYKNGGDDRINTIKICEFEESELRALFLSMRKYLK